MPQEYKTVKKCKEMLQDQLERLEDEQGNVARRVAVIKLKDEQGNTGRVAVKTRRRARKW
jgi:hypothetical protein